MTDLRSDDEIFESELRRRWQREQAAAKSPGGGGKKFDTDKLPVGLMPWPVSIVQILKESGRLDPAVSPIIVEYVSRGKFSSAWAALIGSQNTTLEGALKTAVIGRERYGAYNWKGLDPDRVYQSAMRHAMHIGEPDEGCTHWDHLGWCLAVLIYFDWQPNDKKTD